MALHSNIHKEMNDEWKVKNNDTHFKVNKRVEVVDSINTFKKKMALHPDMYKANYVTFKQ